jgi:hypothetical protein
MAVAEWTKADTERAKKIWADYVAAHDLSERQGQAAGIDPASGRIWFGESATEIVQQMDAADEFRPLYYVRVGKDYYFRKGGRR